MTNGDLLVRLLPLVLQCYNVSDFIADVLQNARRERWAQRLKAKRFKWFSQRKAIVLLARLWCHHFFLHYVCQGRHGHAALVYIT